MYAMCKIKRRRCAEVVGEGMDTTQSSYEKLKARNVIQMQELATVLLSLQLTQQEKKDIETKCEVACKELQDTQRQKLEIATESKKNDGRKQIWRQIWRMNVQGRKK